MKQLALLSALSLTLLASAGAHAAESAELKVGGTLRPTACVPAFSGGGAVDYGVVRFNTLTAGAQTNLAVKSIDLTITCDGPAKVAIRTVDSRAGFIPAGFTANQVYGLGAGTDTKVGAYFLNVATMTVDSTTSNILKASLGTSTWSAHTSGVIYKDFMISWGKAQASPVSATIMKMSINVQAVIDKPENLPRTQDLPFSGSTMFEVIYL